MKTGPNQSEDLFLIFFFFGLHQIFVQKPGPNLSKDLHPFFCLHLVSGTKPVQI